MEDNKKAKQLIEERRYKESIEIIKQKIINYIVSIIKENGFDYEYTNIIDLIEVSKYYIHDDRKNLARNLEYFSIEEDEMITLTRLLDICEKYNIK